MVKSKLTPRMINRKSIASVKEAKNVMDGFVNWFIEKGNHQMAGELLRASNDLQEAIDNMKDANALLNMFKAEQKIGKANRKIR